MEYYRVNNITLKDLKVHDRLRLSDSLWFSVVEKRKKTRSVVLIETDILDNPDTTILHLTEETPIKRYQGEPNIYQPDWTKLKANPKIKERSLALPKITLKELGC